VTDLPPPPVEWVFAGGRWWVFRWVLPAVIVGALITLFYAQWRADPLWISANPLYVWGAIFGALAAEFMVFYAFPSVRRIGLSPLYLVVDIGFQKFTYSWPEVQEISRTRVEHFRWSRVSTVNRTRISVGSGIFKNWYGLSSRQGDRLVEFLRIYRGSPP